MKIIFMGTPDFSVGTLEALVEAGHEVVLAVTQPDKPKGRGKEMQFTPVKECALAHNIPVYQPKKIREPECIEELKKISGRCLRSRGIWTDPSKRDSGNDTVRMYQCSCIPSAEIPRCCTDPMGGHQWRKSIRCHNDADG